VPSVTILAALLSLGLVGGPQFRTPVGDTPESLEALSWSARQDLNSGSLDEALQKAQDIERRCEALLRGRRLDDEPHLPTALGAAYEVEAEVLSRREKKAEAVQLLRAALERWRGTSIAARLQKNLNLLTLEGKPMPALRESEWIGVKPALASSRLRGKVVLLFFWAHWCADCKAEAPVIAELAREYERKGLVIVGPTKLYGYTPEDEHASPAEEKAFIERVYARFYSAIPNLQVPVGDSNFEHFGASTTPTIVLANRAGIVKLYHPGVMDQEALRAAIERLLTPQARQTASR